jgi:uncharacterized protein YciI
MHFPKTICLVFALFFIINSVLAQSDNPKYNKHLADSLGADDYGMKTYMFVILKTGPVQVTDKAKRDSLFAGHLKNIQRLANIGKLAVAGPMQTNDKNYRGILILNVNTIEEARKLLATDPTIEAKLLEAEIYGWYGSAALPMYLPVSEVVGKKSF